MKKSFLYILLITSVATLSPLYAVDQTDALNMSGPVVKIMNFYPGSWNGWSDGCFNCYKQDTSGSVLSRDKKNRQSKTLKQKTKSLPKSVRRGYCECNCKPMATSKNLKSKTHKVYGIKDKIGVGNENKMSEKQKDKTDSETKIKQKTEKSDTKKKGNEQPGATVKEIKIYSLWKA